MSSYRARAEYKLEYFFPTESLPISQSQKAFPEEILLSFRRSTTKKAFPDILLSKAQKFDWITPRRLYEQLDKEFHFQLDAATSQANPLGTSNFYSALEDGLKQPWLNPTFVNPPYSSRNIFPWLQKAKHEQLLNQVTSVFLLPARTSTIWFHEYIYNKEFVEVRFLKGRITFDVQDPDNDPRRGSNTAPFDSAIIIFYAPKDINKYPQKGYRYWSSFSIRNTNALLLE